MSVVEVKAQYGRMKGAEWFPSIFKKDILVLGQGGIGSWTSLMLARAGATLHIYDMDMYEEHNMTGQVVKASDIGKLKTEAVKSIISELSPDAEVSCNGKYTEDSPTNDIVICGFDNMAARKIAFKNWKEFIETLTPEERKTCFFQDGRLLAEQLQIFNLPGDKIEWIERYEKEQLFDDSEVEEVECTFKQTSHCAAMIASHMTGFVTNWLTNVNSKEPAIRQVPYFYGYLIPFNYTS